MLDAVPTRLVDIVARARLGKERSREGQSRSPFGPVTVSAPRWIAPERDPRHEEPEPADESDEVTHRGRVQGFRWTLQVALEKNTDAFSSPVSSFVQSARFWSQP